MDFVLSTGTATAATTYLVAMFKLAHPTAPTYMVVLVALLSGIALAFLVALGQGHALGGETISTSVLSGIFAAAAAAGVRSADNKADEKRGEAVGRQSTNL